MLILGVTNNDTAGACLVKNTRILSAVHEERFTRVKCHKVWPQQSIDFVLRENNITLNDIDIIAYGWKAGFNEDYSLNLYIERIIAECVRNFDNVEILRKRVADELNNDREKRAEFDQYIFLNNLNTRVRYIDHHDTHAWGSWLCSPWNDALVVTCDGRGDFLSFTVRHIVDGNESVLHRETTIDSLGYFYGRITHLLGFTPNRHEGKVAGLAAHGSPQKALPLMRKTIDVHGHRLVASCGDYYLPSYQGYSEKLLEEIRKYTPQDIAAAAQYHTENIICKLIQPYIKNHKIKHVCLAGGLFGNVRLNQKIRELPGIEGVFILPCMGDEGLPLAAAVTAAWREHKTRCRLTGMSLGPQFSDEYVQSLIDVSSDLRCEIPEDMTEHMLHLLRINTIIGVVRGPMEFGPRALCNRSIIYHAHNADINHWLNNKLQRTEFMPFGPVTTENLADICFKKWKSEDIAAEYMIITYVCKPIMKERCPAVVHIDNTARPQVVRNDKDPFMYRLINRWYELTGQPCLVNTSFNRHEEPIINSPLQALSVLRQGIVDVVILNDKYAITRKNTP